MINKPTPEEVLTRLGEPAEGRYGSWHTELVKALREAIKQRDDAIEDAKYWREWAGAFEKERDEALARTQKLEAALIKICAGDLNLNYQPKDDEPNSRLIAAQTLQDILNIKK